MKKNLILETNSSDLSISINRSAFKKFLKLIKLIIQDKKILIGSIIVFSAIFISVFAPWISPYNPDVGDGSLRLAPPGTPHHILGLDDQGRDILSRLIWGGRYSLITAIVPILFASITSVLLGLVAGFFRGIIGELIMRFLEMFFAFPMILKAITIAALIGPGILTIIITIIISLVPYMTRIVYTTVLEEKEKEYIEAARVLGASRTIIILKELLPNVLSPLVIYATTLVGSMIAFSAGLSFLGLGVQPPNSDWGKMTADGVKVLTQGSPHLALIPGLLIVIVSLGFNWLGDGVRDFLDPYHIQKDV